MSVKKTVVACIVLLLVMVLPQAAFAGTVIKVRPGLNGLYRTDRPVPLNITIANDGQSIENGVLEVRADPDNPVQRPQNYAVYRKELMVSANSSTECTVTIPGELANNNPRVFLSIDGQQVASAVVQGMAVSGRMVGISVGEGPLSSGLPAWVDNHMDYLTLKYLSPTEIPPDIWGLDVADLIIMDPSEVNELTPAQVEGIKRWVTLGGCLLLSGGAGAGEGQPFAGISPVIVSGETMISGSLKDLRANTGTISVATGTFVRGEKRVVHGSITVLAKRNIGRGYVVYSAIGLENIGPGDVKLWEQLFDGINHTDHDLARMSRDSMVHNSANIPQLQIPSVKFMAGLWGVYILLVAPGLYLLLKRYNRRDLAWFCIPAMALAAAVIMYFSAPFHRFTGPLGQTLAVVDLLDDNVTEVKAGSSYVMPRGGDLMLTVTGESMVMPEIRYHNNLRENPPVIEYRQGGQQIHFADVEFWSLRQASIYKVVSDFGIIQSNLKLDGNRIVGALENKTPVDLDSCLVILGDKALDIGKLPAGKTVNIDSKLGSEKFFFWEKDLEKLFPNFEEHNVVEQVRLPSTRSAAVIKELGPLEFPTMQLIGYTGDLEGIMELNDTTAHNYTSAMVKQRLSLAVAENGEFRLPAGFVPVHVIESNGGIEHTPDGQLLHGDRVKLEYNLQIPGQYQDIEIKALDLPGFAWDSNYQVKVFNWEDQRWEELKPAQKRLQGAELKPYVSDRNRLRLSIQSFQGVKNIMPLPGVAVEGVVTNGGSY